MQQHFMDRTLTSPLNHSTHLLNFCQNGLKNDVWWPVSCGTVREAPGLLPQVLFGPWTVLGRGFVPPVTNIYS